MNRPIRYIGRGLITSVVGLVSLLVLCLVLVYLPPVQSLIIGKVLTSVTDSTDFDIAVGDARIGFPIDIRIDDISVVRKSDGVRLANVGHIAADVSLMPLFKGLVQADSIVVSGIGLDTRDMIPALALDGRLESARLFGVDFRMEEARLSLMTVSVENSDMGIVLNDTVVEDTVEEESAPFLRKVNVGTMSLKNIGFDLTSIADGDTTFVGGLVRQGVLSATADLDAGKYVVNGLALDGVSGQFSADGLSASLETATLELPDVMVNGEVIRARQLGLTLNESCRLDAKNLLYNLETGEVSADALLNCSDIAEVARILPADMLACVSIPAGSTLTADVSLRDKEVTAHGVGIEVPNAFEVMFREVAYNLETGSVSSGVRAEVVSADGLMALLPEGMAKGFSVPDGMTLRAEVAFSDKRINARNLAILMRDGSSIRMDRADYDMKTGSYDVDMDMDKVFLSRFVRLPESVYFDGHVKARGRGFDFLSPGTDAEVGLTVDSVAYGIYNLTSLGAEVSLGGSALTAHATIDDPSLRGMIDYDGLLTKKRIDGRLDLNIGDMDLKGLGLTEVPHRVALSSTVNLDTDMKTALKVDAGVMGMNIQFGDESILIDEFVAFANASDEGTSVVMYSGDMDFDFKSPMGYKELLAGYADVFNLAMGQLKSVEIDPSQWKAQMPVASLSAHVGTDNPISNLLEFYEIWFDGVDIDISTSPAIGIECDGYLDRFQVGDLKTDLVEFSVSEDSAALNYDFSVSIPEQTGLKSFSASLNGILAGKELQTRLHYYDDKGVEGIDFGLRTQAADSILHMSVYPLNPVIGYRQFEVGDTNFIDLHKKNRIFADIALSSLVDSCRVSVIANPAESYLQNVHLLVENLDLSPLMSVLPFMPSVSGLIKGDMAFVQSLDTAYAISGDLAVDDLRYEGALLGDIGAMLKYNPTEGGGHQVYGHVSRNDEQVIRLDGRYTEELDASLFLDSLPLDIVSALAPELPVAMEGKLSGSLQARGNSDNMHLNGFITPMDTRVFSKVYSLNIGIDNDTISVNDSKIDFGQLHISGAGDNQLTMAGEIDLSDINNPWVNLSLTGRDVNLIDAPKTRQAELYGKVHGDLMIRARGNADALSVMGRVKLLNTSDVTYLMKNTALSMGYRLDDIVTFVDFSLPPDTTVKEKKSFLGLNMNLSLEVEQGARVKCIFSADEKSYVDVMGGGTLTMVHMPEGETQLLGRYTIDKGEMRYSNSVIPLKTFTIQDGSYIEFTGEPMNPNLSLAATERVRASISNTDKSTRMVTFNTGLRLSKSLQNLGLEFTIDAPEDIYVQQELASLTAEDKNKLALSMLATGMYLSNSNTGGFNTTNALNNFLQGEINNIAGKALNSVLKMDMNLGVEHTDGNDGVGHTDYSFKFSKRLFSDRLNVVVGGMINTSGVSGNANKSGTYIDDVSLEWRIDKSGTQYVRLFHGTDFNNLLEGVITENGAGIVLRKKVNDWKDLWRMFQIKK
ncbi:MAG: translocation/assembly module TamB [Bacteroidaceae bacterium]|nr:translocation/assembly module TamB [Bacteroidaceae bacterium]